MKPKDSIKSRMAQYEFTDDQIAEAVFATTDGISESLILEWFLPENSPKKMELARKLQLQKMAPGLTR